ncbi:MFS transporter [Crossiella sp. CA198]|uniref:MFS transporter n=1 Tax=Crossiella sp. CA198 TaxID=3455607 RepID=UPI003F8CFFF4
MNNPFLGSRVTAVLLFAVFGAQLGVWSASLPALAREHGLGPGALGARLAAVALTSVIAVLIAGRISDRRGRRGVAVLGIGLTAVSYGLFLFGPQTEAVSFLLFAAYGLAAGLLDVAANATGSDLEAHTGRNVMVGLHAGFSAGAATGAFGAVLFELAGAGHRELFAVTAVLVFLAGGLVLVAGFPPHRRPAVAPVAGRSPLRAAVIAPIVLVGTVCFFGDGVMQSFVPLYLSQTVGAAAGVALFHLASLCGRVAAVPLLLRGGNEVVVLVTCGLAAAAGVLLVAWQGPAWLALAGMALAGLMLSPVIPIAYSLLGRVAGNSAGAAISLLTACSYGAFTAAPAIAGVLAETVSLRATLMLALCCYLACALIAFLVGRRITGGPHAARAPAAASS